MVAKEHGARRISGVALHELTAARAFAAIRSGELSPIDLLDALLERVDALEPMLQTWAFVDRDGARQAAEELSREAAAGVFRGPLHGVPFAVKDVFHAAGIPTQAGSRTAQGFVPSDDATCIARIRDAGGILLGKLQTTEFAYYDPPPTRNPWNLEHTPGGSSSGSAPPVAARMVPVTLGSQTGGSLIRPASFCGIAALKPSFGRISVKGVIPLTWIHDHVGVMARSVEDLALLFDVMAGHDPNDPTSRREAPPDGVTAAREGKPPRIGLLRAHLRAQADEEVAARTEEAVARLEEAGAQVEDVNLPESFGATSAVSWVTILVGVAAVHTDLWAEKADLLQPTIRAHIEVGQLIPAELYLRALRIRRIFIDEASAALTNFDVLVTPSSVTPAPKGLESTGDPAFQFAWTLAGFPMLTLPIGLSASELPLGIQLIARPFAERTLLSSAAWCERVLGPQPAPPIASN